ncbi:hypothetical protein IEQ34_022781 [Dendrobium chrysotoxum]|uniref:AtTam37 zinc finger domain-containing protein n=1 Tax=Dendrobium chrysotoxum TaxID=161865 RepID=A0AAV7FY33_DENCH|nr:hypothetical protein IEQ34_022781 [Dendrobium chrysotoxum]
MSRGTARLMKAVQQKLDIYSKIFVARYGQQVIDILELPIKVVLSPFTLAFDIAGSAPRGFGIPELASHLSFTAIFAVATLGTYDIALELGKKVLCQRNCHTCNGWQALRCTMCKGTGKVHYQVRNYRLKSGERATAECVAEAVAENRAELVHLPSSIDFSVPLPTKDCSSCSGTGVMGCPDCRHHVPLRISADDDSMRYDQLRDAVAKRKPGWEHLQSALISLDPTRARDDPVIVKNIPYYKAKKNLEAEVMKLEVPPRPSNWGDLDLPLTESSWTMEELKDPNKLLEMFQEILDEKLQPYVQSVKGVLPQIIATPSPNQENKIQKKTRRRRWWFF